MDRKRVVISMTSKKEETKRFRITPKSVAGMVSLDECDYVTDGEAETYTIGLKYSKEKADLYKDNQFDVLNCKKIRLDNTEYLGGDIQKIKVLLPIKSDTIKVFDKETKKYVFVKAKESDIISLKKTKSLTLLKDKYDFSTSNNEIFVRFEAIGNMGKTKGTINLPIEKTISTNHVEIFLKDINQIKSDERNNVSKIRNKFEEKHEVYKFKTISRCPPNTPMEYDDDGNEMDCIPQEIVLSDQDENLPLIEKIKQNLELAKSSGIKVFEKNPNAITPEEKYLVLDDKTGSILGYKYIKHVVREKVGRPMTIGIIPRASEFNDKMLEYMCPEEIVEEAKTKKKECVLVPILPPESSSLYFDYNDNIIKKDNETDEEYEARRMKISERVPVKVRIEAGVMKASEQEDVNKIVIPLLNDKEEYEVIDAERGVVVGYKLVGKRKTVRETQKERIEQIKETGIGAGEIAVSEDVIAKVDPLATFSHLIVPRKKKSTKK